MRINADLSCALDGWNNESVTGSRYKNDKRIEQNAIQDKPFELIIVSRGAFRLTRFVEQRFHGGVLARELLDRKIFGFVICQTKLIFAADRVVLDLLQVIDRLIDLFDGLWNFWLAMQ